MCLGVCVMPGWQYRHAVTIYRTAMRTVPTPTNAFRKMNSTLRTSYLNILSNKNMEQIKLEMKANGLSMETDKNEFALTLKTWRLRNGITQSALARRWGCSRFTIMRAEGAKDITWEMAYKLFVRLSDELRKEAANG